MRAEIIGFDSGWGCRDWRCEDGPHALPADLILQSLNRADVSAKWRGPMGLKNLARHADMNTKEKSLPVVMEGLRRLSGLTRNAVEQGHIPVVIGGDHSSAVGTWSGAITGANAANAFGLIWLDAHLDAHTYATSGEGKWGGWWHGQPVAALTGHGIPEFVNMAAPGRKISPKHMSMIGIHSFEPAEKAYVERHGIRVYYLDEVKKRGFETVFAEALARASAGTKGFGLTVDIDCFHAEDAPGVGTPEGDGMRAAEVLPIIKSLARKPGFKALEIAEFNPHNDPDGRTARLVQKLIESTFAKD
jgi:arginase